MKYKLTAFLLAVTLTCWAQTSTENTSSTPQQSTQKTQCSCCTKAGAEMKDGHACCAHEMKASDGKEMGSCCARMQKASCCSGKDAKSCKRDKNAKSCCGDKCNKDKMAADCCGGKCGKDCCSPEGKNG